MTGDELDRAIQFLLEGQAKNDALIGHLGIRVDQLTADVNRLTGDFADFKVLVREFAESTRLFAERADERLERLEQDAERGDKHQQRLDKALAELAEQMNALTSGRIHLLKWSRATSPMRPGTGDRRDDRHGLPRCSHSLNTPAL